MSEDDPIVTAAGGDKVKASALVYFAAMLLWLTDHDPYDMARKWIQDVGRYTEPGAQA